MLILCNAEFKHKGSVVKDLIILKGFNVYKSYSEDNFTLYDTETGLCKVVDAYELQFLLKDGKIGYCRGNIIRLVYKEIYELSKGLYLESSSVCGVGSNPSNFWIKDLLDDGKRVHISSNIHIELAIFTLELMCMETSKGAEVFTINDAFYFEYTDKNRVSTTYIFMHYNGIKSVINNILGIYDFKNH